MQFKPISILASLLLVACSSAPNYTTDVNQLPIPDRWQPSQSVESFDNNWWQQIISENLSATVVQALKQNHQLKQRELALKAAEQGLVTTGAALLPSLDGGLTSSRRKSQPSGNLSTNHDLSLDLRYEIDLWGKLNDNHKRATLQYQAQALELVQFRSDLMRQVIGSWFKVIESEQQLALNELRLKNSQQNLDIIESGYQSGLNSALDVYLTRNEVATEKSRVASQRTTVKQDKRALELLLGHYPAADIALEENEIPSLSPAKQLGLPSELIARKPQLKATWLSVLAKDAEVAYLYKQRFPGISLSGAIGTASEDLSDLLSSDLAWSLISNLSAPVFQGGTLKANEQRARLELAETEQRYLQSLYEAFAEVENALSADDSLMASYQANIEAAENATFAESLSFEQYQKGLVSYTTVLDAQARAFNAQSSVIQLKYQLLNNRLQLFSALGGDFNTLFPEGDS